VAADDAGGKIHHDGPIAETLRDGIGVDHHGARNVAFGDRHADVAGGALLLAAVLAQALQLLEAADIALAAGGHAVGEPVLLADDLPVELVASGLLLLEGQVAPRLEGG